ncbi:hypothetical protein KPL39_14545 [Clostridium gasigenes]|uniref:hypothetical protein n=1 Tax=Clostridium gasigenes TaxID=94869 RepID=UPI001C0B2673|nr:hypothetical protein [Clostridium gasigenes]MBU3137482.1 hypothetical protein [Clostridium gasigenes]
MDFEFHGITEELLKSLSYESTLGKSLKNTLRKFDKDSLINEIIDIKEFYESSSIWNNIKFSYRIKSVQSSILKYNKYYPSIEVNKCFNDLLGIRLIVKKYDEILNQDISEFKIANMMNGKAKDDGYRGIHLYYQKSTKHYPIEIQINSVEDRKLNDWLHINLYKRTNANEIGKYLRHMYDIGKINNESEFMEVLENVLSSSKEI